MHRLGSSAFQGRSPHLALYHPQGSAEHYERAHEFSPHYFPLHSQFSQGGMALGSLLHNKTSGPTPLFNGTGAFRRIGPHEHGFSPFHPLHQQARSLSPREREREREHDYKNSESSDLRSGPDENHNERKSPRGDQNGDPMGHDEKYSLRYDDEKKSQQNGEALHIKREPGHDDECCSSEPEKRTKRRRLSSDHLPCCPVCNITIRPGELKSHFEWEIERLFQRDDGRNGRKREAALHARKVMTGIKKVKDEKPDVPNDDSPASTRHQTYLRVCANRMARSGSPVGQREERPAEGSDAGPSGVRTANCPVCSLSISGSSEELNSHVENCLRKKGEISTEDGQEGRVDRFEEYEWAGQHRVRATALLEDGYRGMGFDAPKKEKEEDDGTDLNVDGDDSEYGKAQFTESDIIPCSSDEPTDDAARQAIRGAVISGENSATDPSNPERSRWQNSSEETGADESSPKKSPVKLPTVEEIEKSSEDPTEVISGLKSLVKEQEKQITSDKHKCLICMEHYSSPLVSIGCWHVHCEECWLRTLGAKKLCPQCNTITSPNDLRRIFL